MAHAPIDEDSTIQSLDLTGTGMAHRDHEVRFHGPEQQFVWPGRTVVDVPDRVWPAARPEDCTDESGQGEWINNELLVCRGCGLDCT